MNEQTTWLQSLRNKWREAATRQMPPPPEPPISIALRTQAREDLFDICHWLMTSLEQHILTDPACPLTVGLMGKFQGGKSIFRDATRLALLGDPQQSLVTGYHDASFWWREQDMPKIAVGFFNARETFVLGRSVRDFIRRSYYGGILLISNPDWGSEYFTRYEEKTKKYYEVTGNCCLEKFGMLIKLELASGVADVKDPRRSLVIEVRDQRLLKSKRFKDALDTIMAHRDKNGIFQASTSRRDASAYPSEIKMGTYNKGWMEDKFNLQSFNGPATELDLYTLSEKLKPQQPQKKSRLVFW